MKENFLHFLWRFRRFDHTDLKTTGGHPVEILHPGQYNQHAGPDFINARLRINHTEWAGNVEMHLKSSEWWDHNHQNDQAYDNIILHVVLEEDRPVLRADGSPVPCLEIKKRIPAGLLGTYQKILHNEYWIPCQHQFFSVSEITKNLWLDRLLVERLERKTEAIKSALLKNNMDWEETFYQFTARNFGLKINAQPFELVARSLPQNLLARHKDNLLQIEALLFGQAGMLENVFVEKYPGRLKQEYLFLKKKYQLVPVDPHLWKFLRLHPANFPTVRLAQFAQLIFRSIRLFSKILEVETIKEIEKLFTVKPGGYWLTHYKFEKESEKRNKSFGKEAIRLLTINTIVPFLFLYGSETGEESFKDKAFRLLEEISPEKNKIIKGWEALGIKAGSACQSQALLQLKNEYCDKKKCLECNIGGAILK
ncbi:MAG TPA: DUF2851 family protein [Bacteroidetes bacterium]|nr:DUF2851 family protein [Bacteroidota bacterium]